MAKTQLPQPYYVRKRFGVEGRLNGQTIQGPLEKALRGVWNNHQEIVDALNHAYQRGWRDALKAKRQPATSGGAR